MKPTDILKSYYNQINQELDSKCTWSAKGIQEILHNKYVEMLEDMASNPETINVVVSTRGEVLSDDPRIRIINRNIKINENN